MKKVTQRLLTFFIGVPLIVSLAVIRFYNHLPLHLTVMLVTIIASREMTNLLKQKMSTQPTWFVIILSSLIPLSTTLYIDFKLPYFFIILTIIFICFISMVKEIFAYDKKTLSFDNALQRITSSLFTAFYCGYLISFVLRMTPWEHSSSLIGLFLLIVFGSDSIAWFFGMLLGKNNRGIIKASPNKSIAGFIGGFIGSLAVAILVWFVLPFFKEQSLVSLLVLAFFTCLAAIVGDLIESVFKRSANIKDSGSVIPGRGGILDSIDSIVLAAPVYFTLASLLFNFSL